MLSKLMDVSADTDALFGGLPFLPNRVEIKTTPGS